MQKTSNGASKFGVNIVELVSATSQLPLTKVASVWLSAGGSAQRLMEELNELVVAGKVQLDLENAEPVVATWAEGNFSSRKSPDGRFQLSHGELAAISATVMQVRAADNHALRRVA